MDEAHALVTELFVSQKRTAHSDGLLASALLAELLRRRGAAAEVVEGYWHSSECAGRHYWVWVDAPGGGGAAVDVGTDVLRALVPDFPDVQLARLPQLGKRRVDDDTEDERRDLARLEADAALYRRRGLKALLKGAPGFARRFAKAHGLA